MTLCRLSKNTIEKRQLQWQERETHLVALAEQMLEGEGFSAFSMERLVRECSYSKGTVYRHFSSKEDCLAEIAIRGQQQMLIMFRSASSFDGLMRERFLGFHFAYQLFHQMYPTIFHSIKTIRTPAFAEKISRERAEQIKNNDKDIMDVVYQMFDQSERDGSLSPDNHYTKEVFVHLNWAMTYGVSSLLQTGFDPESVLFLEQQNMYLSGANTLLDGMGITPLSRDYDYHQTWQFFEQKLFKQEFEQLQKIKKDRSASINTIE